MALSAKARTALTYILPIFFVLLLFPSPFISDPVQGLDPSWMIALNLAYKYHLHFGKDIVFTYGPLSVLRYRFAISIPKIIYVISDAWFLFTLFYGFRTLIVKHFRYAPLIFLAVCVLNSLDMEMEQWYYFFILFFLVSFLQEPGKTAYIIMAGLLSILCFYIKVNSGVILVLIFLATVHYMLAVKKLKTRTYGIITLSYFFVLLMTARLLHTDLSGYLRGSMAFIGGYSETMYLPLTGEFGIISGWGAVIIFLFLLAGVAFFMTDLIRKRQIPAQRDAIFIYAITGLSIYLWYKSAFVRADTHVFHFFKMIDLLVFILFLYTPAGVGKRVMSICCWAILGMAFITLSLLPNNNKPTALLWGRSAVLLKIHEIKDYFTGLRDYEKARAESDALMTRPNKYNEIIGRHTVDIVPQEISTIYFNGLTYDPRPALQSYAAYNQYLDGLDSAKYVSADAPDYILYSYVNIGERFAWADETRTRLAMMANYEVTGEIDEDALLRKRKSPRELSASAEEVTHVRLGEDIPIKKSTGFQFTQFFVDYGLKGRAMNFCYQPPALKMTFTLEDGEVITYRALRPILANGMILNKFVDNNQELRLFMLSDGRMNVNVRSVKLEEVTPGGYKPDIKMITRYYMPEEVTESERVADSLGIGRLLDGYRKPQPLPKNLSDSDQENFRFEIESFKDHSNIVRIGGWAFLEKDSNTNNVVKILAKSEVEGKLYEFPSSTLERTDLPVTYNREDLKHSGFSAMIARSQLPPGNYQLGIALYNTVTGKKRIRYTDDYISEYRLEKISPGPSTYSDAGKLKYNIETIDEYEDKFMVRGWAILQNGDSNTVTNLILQSAKATYRINTDLKKRPDLVNKYNNAHLEYSGFFVAIAKDSLPTGRYSIAIEKGYPGGKTLARILTGLKLVQGFSDQVAPVRIDGLPPNHDFSHNIDVLKDTLGAVTIQGWALNDVKTIAKDSIQIILKGNNVIYMAGTDKTPRPDIQAKFSNLAGTDSCGFSVKISKERLPKGKYRLGIRIYRPGEAGVIVLTDQFIKKE